MSARLPKKVLSWERKAQMASNLACSPRSLTSKMTGRQARQVVAQDAAQVAAVLHVGIVFVVPQALCPHLFGGSAHEQVVDVMANGQRGDDLAGRRQRAEQLCDLCLEPVFGGMNLAKDLGVRVIQWCTVRGIQPVDAVGNFKMQVVCAEDGTGGSIFGAAFGGSVAGQLPPVVEAGDVLRLCGEHGAAGHDGDDEDALTGLCAVKDLAAARKGHVVQVRGEVDGVVLGCAGHLHELAYGSGTNFG